MFISQDLDSDSFGIVTFKTLKLRRSNPSEEQVKSRPRSVRIISTYATWRQNENRTRQSASALLADLGPLKPSAFDKVVITSWRWRMCPQGYFWHWKWKESWTTWHRQPYHIVPPSWMVNERSRWLRALPLYTIIQPVRPSLSVCISPTAAKSSPDSGETETRPF